MSIVYGLPAEFEYLIDGLKADMANPDGPFNFLTVKQSHLIALAVRESLGKSICTTRNRHVTSLSALQTV